MYRLLEHFSLSQKIDVISMLGPRGARLIIALAVSKTYKDEFLFGS